MACGTAAPCYVPKKQRKGGKELPQRRYFRAVILGYEKARAANQRGGTWRPRASKWYLPIVQFLDHKLICF